jgi:hypothetical protein
MNIPSACLLVFSVLVALPQTAVALLISTMCIYDMTSRHPLIGANRSTLDQKVGEHIHVRYTHSCRMRINLNSNTVLVMSHQSTALISLYARWGDILLMPRLADFFFVYLGAFHR